MTDEPGRSRRVPILIAAALTGAVAAVVVAVAAAAPDASLDGRGSESGSGDCRRGELPAPEESGGGFLDGQARLSASGEYVLASVEGTWTLWRDGRVADSAAEAPGDKPVAVNSEGVAVGTLGAGEGNFLAADGGFTELAGPKRAVAIGIADTGTVAGNIVGETREGSPLDLAPLIWADGEATELDLEPGMRGGARAVTAAGDVLGFQAPEGSHNEVEATPWLWRADGTGTALPQPHESSAAVPLDVAGDWVLAKSATRADTYRYRLSDPDTVEAFDADRAGYRIDGTGRIYGAADGKPSYWDGDAAPVPLPDGRGGAVDDVSDDGTVVVGAEYGTGGAVTGIGYWTCER